MLKYPLKVVNTAVDSIGQVQSECFEINSTWLTWSVKALDKVVCLSLYLTCFTDSLGNGGRYNFTFSVPKHFNYISFQVQRFSNRGADIDACVDKAANIQNEINKDFEEGVTANFAQCSASNSDQYIDLIFIMFFILREINSVFCLMPACIKTQIITGLWNSFHRMSLL